MNPTSLPTPAPVSSTPAPTPTPLPTPTPFIGGAAQAATGGGAPEGGAACSGGIGRSPTAAELDEYLPQLAAGADATSIQTDILASDEYFRDAGGTPVGFITRLYNDVLGRDPTPVEVAVGLGVLSANPATGRSALAQLVVFSPEARAIRVDQVVHTLLDIYPTSADLALWVNLLPGSDATTIVSGDQMLADFAASPAFYARAGNTQSGFENRISLYLLDRRPIASDVTTDAALLGADGAASQAARLRVAQSMVNSQAFRIEEINSFFASYLHPTCNAIAVQECTSSVRVPSSTELAYATGQLASGSTEEDLIVNLLGSDEFYADQGSTQQGFVSGVYWDLLGRAPTGGELTAALSHFTNDSIGHTTFVRDLLGAYQYQSLLVALDYQQLLLRTPLSSEIDSGDALLGGYIGSLQTPDEALLETIIATPEFYADAGHSDTGFVERTYADLLMRDPTANELSAFLKLPAPHDAAWQSGVAQALLNGSEYRADYVRGMYAKYLTFHQCDPVAETSSSGGGGFLAGWVGLGIGAVLLGIVAVAFVSRQNLRRFLGHGGHSGGASSGSPG